MVTYEPNQAILTRLTSRGIPQVHVQYFGISAVRGWVSHLQYEPLVDTTSRRLPIANLGKKMKCEFNVAIREASEALGMTHKERKLKFIFNFDPLPAPSQETPHTQRKREGEIDTKQEPSDNSDRTWPDTSNVEAGVAERRRRGRPRRDSTRCVTPPAPKRTKTEEFSPDTLPSELCTHRALRKRRRDLVVSVNISGLDQSSGSLPSLLVGQSPTTMDSYAVSVDTVLNSAVSGADKPVNGALRNRGRPKRVAARQNNFHHTPVLGKKRLELKSVRLEPVSRPPPVRRVALDHGSESGSETSGMSIASAILTPPSSVTEGMMEDDDTGGCTSGEGSVTNHSEQGSEGDSVKPLEVAALSEDGDKLIGPQNRQKPRATEGPYFQDGECAICDASDTNLLACQGHCFQTFHVDCLGLIQPPSFQFVCDECQMVARQCFVCSQSLGVLERCSKPKCGKFYHRSCIRDNPLFVYDSLKTKFTCPLHSCAKCVCSDLDPTLAPRGNTLVQCIKCPLALHKPHCLIAGCNLLSGSQMVCYLHIHIESELNLYKHLNMDTCLECGNSGSLYCCDFCSSAYHKECMEEHHMPVEVEGGGRRERGQGGREVVEVGDKWICPACRDHDLPTYESVVLCKFGVWR